MKLIKNKKGEEGDSVPGWIIGLAIALGLLVVGYVILSGWGKSTIEVLKSIFR